MSDKKITVTLEVDPTKSYTIRPLGETLAEQPLPTEEGIQGTGSASGGVGSVDVDVDIEF